MWLLLDSGFPSVTDAQETHKLDKVIGSILWFPGSSNSETKESLSFCLAMRATVREVFHSHVTEENMSFDGETTRNADVGLVSAMALQT